MVRRLAGRRGRTGRSRVVRPHTTPLFHPVTRPDGSAVEAWTTFGPDQVDVDVRTPAVLVDLTDVLLGYLSRGAGAVRLDAIRFLWKQSGTNCCTCPRPTQSSRLNYEQSSPAAG